VLQGPFRAGLQRKRRRTPTEPTEGCCLAGRSEFRQGLIVDGKQQKQQLVSGGRDDCISDAAAMMMNSDHKFAWVFFGDDRSFNRARQYVEFCTPGRRLVDVSKTMTNTPGGVAFALINSSGRYLLQMTYDHVWHMLKTHA
jgi:hypothetical protein